MSADLALSKLRLANIARRAANYPMCRGWTHTDRATELAGEVGELCNLIKKARRGESIPFTAFVDEIADVLICLDLVAEGLGVNLAEATREKFNKTSRKIVSEVYL